MPPPANDDFEFIAPPPKTRGNLALKPAAEEAAYDCPIRFPGQWQDEETGLYYNRHRYYDPLAAQYTSPDPIGLEGGARPHGYVENPCISIDILGLEAIAGNINLMGTIRNDSNFFHFANKRPASNVNPNGVFDVIAHGNPTHVEIVNNAAQTIVVRADSRILARLIKGNNQYKKGQAVRLLSCETGASSSGIAQHLANKLGAPVIAPSHYIWAAPNGELAIGGAVRNNTALGSVDIYLNAMIAAAICHVAV